MYCNSCGKVIPDEALVCAYCARPVGAVNAYRKLVRPRAGRKLAGVCLAFARHFDLDVTLIRVVWLIAAIIGIPFGIIAYVISWIVIPEEPETAIVAQPNQQRVANT